MPLPAYFICTEGLSVDRDTNRITAYNLAEGLLSIQISAMQQAAQNQQPIIPPTPLRLVSVWMREDKDNPGIPFEHQFVFHIPGNEEITAGETPFAFTKSRFHRLISPPTIIPGIATGGILKIESRIRQKGDNNWIGSQFFYLELLPIQLPMPNLSETK